MKAKCRVLSRAIESWELTPALERMEVGVPLKLPFVHDAYQIRSFRSVIYQRNYWNNRVKLWKTHARPDGFYVERWR